MKSVMDLRYYCWIICIAVPQMIHSNTALQDVCPERMDVLPIGRKCQKSCEIESDCLSKKKSCQCDGICGKSCIKQNQECPPLPVIEQGFVEILPDNRQFAAVARYRCRDGYKLRGDQIRVCQGDETWSGTAPQCFPDRTIEKVECSYPPAIHNAAHDGSPDRKSFPLGTMLQYNCLPGFSLHRDAVQRAWCVGGGLWVGPNMTCSNAGCQRLDGIENGWVDQDPSNSVGSKAVYNCKNGFYLAGRAERICNINGVWEGVPPSCEKVTCTAPPVVENAQHDGNLEQKMFFSGQQLLYTCKKGYYADGTPQVMCTGDGHWVGLTLTCSPRSCGFPGDLDNGWRSGYQFTYPNKVSFNCHEGFELRGAGYIVCQAEGNWSDKVPVCFQINCGWPGPFYNGYLIGHKTTVGSTLFFSCNTRTTFKGSNFQATCLENGTWSHEPPICLGQCQVPSIPNATIQGGRELVFVNHETLIDYQCRPGLVPRESPTMRCDNGTWSTVGECVPAPCPSTPPHVHNGMRMFMGQDHGFQAKYKCFAGYQLTGMNGTYLTCYFGDWVGGKPHCKDLYCPNPGTIQNGQVYKKIQKGRFDFKPYITEIRHGDRLQYECNVGFQLIGPGGATCVNGQWQPPLDKPETKCVEAKHPPVRKLWIPMSNMYK